MIICERECVSGLGVNDEDMPYVGLYTGLEYPAKLEEKLSEHDIASYTDKIHQLVCWQASISVNWAVCDVCKVFASLLGNFGTELPIAALSKGPLEVYLVVTCVTLFLSCMCEAELLEEKN